MNNEFSIVLVCGHDTVDGLAMLEKAYIKHVYKLAKYNQSKAAKYLGLSRGCLRMKLKEYFGDEFI